MTMRHGNFARLKAAATYSKANAVRGNVDARASWGAASSAPAVAARSSGASSEIERVAMCKPFVRSRL
jgi:hypothetical protein